MWLRVPHRDSGEGGPAPDCPPAAPGRGRGTHSTVVSPGRKPLVPRARGTGLDWGTSVRFRGESGQSCLC